MKQQNETRREAFSKLYTEYSPMVFRRCEFLLKDHAEAGDIMQNVFLRIYDRWEHLDLSSLSSLLWNTATRLCLNRLRDKVRRGVHVSSEDLLLQIACAQDEADDFESKGILQRIFSKEPKSTRTIAVLHFVDGMTLEETAETVGLSVSGVRKRLRNLQNHVQELEAKNEIR